MATAIAKVRASGIELGDHVLSHYWGVWIPKYPDDVRTAVKLGYMFLSKVDDFAGGTEHLVPALEALRILKEIFSIHRATTHLSDVARKFKSADRTHKTVFILFFFGDACKIIKLSCSLTTGAVAATTGKTLVFGAVTTSLGTAGFFLIGSGLLILLVNDVAIWYFEDAAKSTGGNRTPPPPPPPPAPPAPRQHPKLPPPPGYGS